MKMPAVPLLFVGGLLITLGVSLMLWAFLQRQGDSAPIVAPSSAAPPLVESPPFTRDADRPLLDLVNADLALLTRGTSLDAREIPGAFVLRAWQVLPKGGSLARVELALQFPRPPGNAQSYPILIGPSYTVDRSGPRIVERPDIRTLERSAEIASHTVERAHALAIEKLQTLDRYKYWQQKGRTYTTEARIKSDTEWVFTFDVPDVTDQVIWITVDTGKGEVVNVGQGEA